VLHLVTTPVPTVADKIRGEKIFTPTYTFNLYEQAAHNAESSVKNHSHTTAQEMAAFHADNSLPTVTHPLTLINYFIAFYRVIVCYFPPLLHQMRWRSGKWATLTRQTQEEVVTSSCPIEQ
jgi:hypothetical protein